MDQSALWAGFLLLLLTFTSFRITRLVIADTFPPIARFRDWIISKVDRDWFESLMDCGWCAGSYISVAVVAIAWFFIPLHYPALYFFSVAALTGILAEHYS